MPACEHEQCAEAPDRALPTRALSSALPHWAIALSIYKMLRRKKTLRVHILCLFSLNYCSTFKNQISWPQKKTKTKTLFIGILE